MSKDWYARKFSGAPARRDSVPALPEQSPQGLPQQPTPYGAPQPPPPPTNARTPYEAAFQQGDAAGGQQTQRLRQKLSSDFCPQCGSSDYLGASNSAPHCFSCGFNGGRFSHELG